MKTRTIRSQRAAFGAAAATLILALSACGGGGDDSKDKDQGSDDVEAQRLKYVECMRENGADLTGSKEITKENADKQMESEVFQKALEACKSLNPAGEEGAKPIGGGMEGEKGVKIARCLRGEGVDAPDDLMNWQVGEMTPKMEKAFEKCGFGS